MSVTAAVTLWEFNKILLAKTIAGMHVTLCVLRLLISTHYQRIIYNSKHQNRKFKLKKKHTSLNQSDLQSMTVYKPFPSTHYSLLCLFWRCPWWMIGITHTHTHIHIFNLLVCAVRKQDARRVVAVYKTTRKSHLLYSGLL